VCLQHKEPLALSYRRQETRDLHLQCASESSVAVRAVSLGAQMIPRSWWPEWRWAGHVAHMGDTRNVNIILVEIPERKRPLGRRRNRRRDNNRLDLREIGWEVL